MTHHVPREQSEAKPAADGEPETDDLWSTTHSLLVRVEYYRSFEYCLKWKLPMYPRRSLRQTKPSKKLQKSPSPDEEVVQRKYKQVQRQKETKDGDGVFNASKGTNRDLIDIIGNTSRAKRTAEEDKGKFVEINDNGLDDSDDDRASIASSITSGPSHPYLTTPKKLTFLWDLCSDCQKLYHRAKRMKAPMKDKLLDNDPKSLTCDQWVLIKLWKPKKRVKSKKEVWKVSDLIREIMTRHQSKKYTKQNEKCAGVEGSTSCSRPHIFLQRNMRRCIKTQVKKAQKKKRKSRKRTRDNSQGSRVAKQQRLDGNNHRQHGDTSCDDISDHHPTSSDNSRAGLENSTGEEIHNQTEMLQTVGLVPSTATEKNKLKELPPKLKTQKRNGFQELLAQLRGNNSMIVKETH